MKKRHLVIQGYTGDFFVLLIQALSILIFVNNNPGYLYASWVLVLALVNPVVGFSSMSIDSLISTEENNDKIKEFLSARFLNILVFLPVVLLVNYFYKSNASPWFLLLLAYLLKSLEAFFISFRGIYYRDKSIRSVSISKVIAKLGYLIGFGYFIEISQSLSLSLIVIIIWNFVSFIIYDVVLQKNLNFIFPIIRFNYKTYKTFSKKYYLFGFNNFLTLLAVSIPQIYIERYLDLDILGLIGIVMLFNSATDNVYISLLKTLRKSYADVITNNISYKKLINQITILYTFFLIIFSLGTVFLGNFFFEIYNQNFPKQDQLLLLVFSGSFLYYLSNSYNFIYFIKRDVIQILKFNTLRTLVAIIFSFYFITNFGFIGFGYSYLFTNFIYALYTFKKFTEIIK